VLVALVEQGAADGWRSFPITPAADDARAAIRLRDAIAERKASRVPTEPVEAEQALAKLIPAVVESKIRLLRGGHVRIAARAGAIA